MIFCSQNITKIHAIFLLGEVGQGSMNIQELFQDFWSNKNEGCFGALVSGMSFRREIEYFSFMKNIPWVSFGIFRERKLS